MKPLQYKILHTFLLFFGILTSGILTHAQSGIEQKDKASYTQAMIAARHYVFMAQSAHPTRGRIIQLTSGYELSVLGDTLRAYLPYFGRAYSAPMDGRGGGIDFISKDFDYKSKDRKKGGWEITLKPKDISDVREINMTVFENGLASVRVASNNKEPISYNGYLEQKK